MKVRTVLAAAGLSLTVASFSVPVFAQVGGIGFSGLPAITGSSGVLQQAPSAGQPGTQAPASAAPIGTSTSDWMSEEGGSIADHSLPMPGPQDTQMEKQLRMRETTLERDIAAYRAYSYNVQPAAWEKWLGSESLARGDRIDAAKHFQKATMDLRRLSEAGPYALRSDHSDSALHGNETSEIMNASNMHSNRSSSSVY